MTENITEFRNISEDDIGRRSIDKRIRRYKVLKLYKISAIVIVLIIILALLFINWKNQIYSTYEVKQEYEWNRIEGNKVVQLEKSILTYGNNGISVFDSKGKAVWNQTYEMQNPIVSICKNVVAVADYNGRKIYIANSEKIIGSVDTTMPIREIKVATNGIVVAVLDDSNITAISMYNTNGEEMAYFKTTMSKSGYPISIAISDDSKHVAVSYLNSQKGEILSNIGFYNFSSVGQNYTDNLVGAHGYMDSVIPFMTYLDGNSFVAVADNKLMFFEGEEIPHNVIDYFISQPIQGIYHNKKYIGLLYYNTDGEETYKMDIYNAKGEKMQTILFDFQFKDIVFGEDSLIIYNETSCEVYNWKGKKKYSGLFEQVVDCIIPGIGIDKYTIVNSNKIQNIVLK